MLILVLVLILGFFAFGMMIILPIPYILSRIVRSIAYGLQRADISDKEAMRRASTISTLIFILLVIIASILLCSRPFDVGDIF
jgi:hypothetical protein